MGACVSRERGEVRNDRHVVYTSRRRSSSAGRVGAIFLTVLSLGWFGYAIVCGYVAAAMIAALFVVSLGLVAVWASRKVVREAQQRKEGLDSRDDHAARLRAGDELGAGDVYNPEDHVELMIAEAHLEGGWGSTGGARFRERWEQLRQHVELNGLTMPRTVAPARLEAGLRGIRLSSELLEPEVLRPWTMSSAVLVAPGAMMAPV